MLGSGVSRRAAWSAWCFVGLSSVAIACSSKSASGDADASTDASVGANRPVGGSCDPALGASACGALVGSCTTAVCDPSTRLCVLVTSDASGCSITRPSCQASGDCPGSDVCVSGFCYQSCEAPSDCVDAGTCTEYCTTPPGCGEEDACAQTCSGYCTTGFGG